MILLLLLLHWIKRRKWNDNIVWAAEKFLGTTEIKSMSEKILKYSRLYALEGVPDALARQPEAIDQFDSFSMKFLGTGIK